jgi:hypothetical protein
MAGTYLANFAMTLHQSAVTAKLLALTLQQIFKIWYPSVITLVLSFKFSTNKTCLAILHT